MGSVPCHALGLICISLLVSFMLWACGVYEEGEGEQRGGGTGRGEVGEVGELEELVEGGGQHV